MEVVVKNIGAAFSVAVIPVLRDNYSYVIQCKTTNALAAVDVSADVAPVINYLQRISHGNGRENLLTVLSTHKHYDHTGGNLSMQKMFGALDGFRIIGGVNEAVPGVTHKVREGDKLTIGALQVDVLDAPCHTSGHVLYKIHHPQYVNDGAALFTGDTMFVGGIGAFFEGDATLMCRALRKVYHLNGTHNDGLNRADEETWDNRTYVFPGHEYTVNFLRFSYNTLPSTHPDYKFVESQLRRYTESVANKLPTVPSTLAEEKRQNLFLRTCDETFVRDMNRGKTAEELMDYLYNACP
uniref:Glyoxalase II n=1 Tax=Trypanosoma congolense (strain IL3000) TaxID=1068625 RepID=G0UN68_TRYCI|nr:glyoxalase II [Trypanosoma congolense IL3000]